MLRADFTMDETYYDKTGIVLHAPIAAFGGEKDGEADESAICEWGKYTDNDFSYRIFPGGHFYLRDYEDEVISEVIRRLPGIKMEIKRYGAKEFLAAGKLCIRENEIHIWCICWPEMTDFWVNHEYILSGQESEQVGRFRFSEDRMRYIAGKVVVRLLLKRYLDVETIDFSVSERGKPYHKKIAGKQTVDFNISHSGEFILAGFAVGMDIGVDVQEMAGCPDYWEIAGNFYTEEEAEDVIKEGSALFFQYWAAKEAYVKALGIGLGRGMDFFSVRNGEIIEKGRNDQGWFLYPVRIKGYAAYVAVHKKGDKSNGL